MPRTMDDLFADFERIFREEMQRSILESEEYPDILRMIDMLACARSERQESATIEHYIFSGTTICTILEPIKWPSYRDEARQFRLNFRGIATDQKLQERYAGTFTDKLLGARNIQEALDLGFAKLFQQSGGMLAGQ